MAIRRFVLISLCCALANTGLGLSVHTVLINGDIEIEWPMSTTRQVSFVVFEKDDGQLLRIDETNDFKATNGPFYAELKGKSALILKISNASLENNGIYSYTTYYYTGNAEEGMMLLRVQGQPDLFNVSSDTVEGDVIHALCCVESTMEPLMTWRVDTSIFYKIKQKASVQTISDYKYCDMVDLTSHRVYNDKSLICEVQNGLHLSVSSSLNVSYEPTVTASVDSAVMCSKVTCILREFTDALIICTGEGNPIPNVVLESPLRRIDLPEWNSTFIGNVSEFTVKRHVWIANITRNHYGLYKCRASNGVGNVVYDAVLLNITFDTAVKMLTSPSNMFTSNGSFIVECASYSNPLAEMSLQKVINGEWATLRSSTVPESKTRFTAIWKFTFDEIIDAHEGRYRCKAYNGIGRPATSNPTILSPVQLNRKGRRRKELPEIPVDEDNSQNSHHSEGSEPNYYSTADAIAGNNTRMLSEKDISIIMNIKMGKIYQRWMGSVNLTGETNKCVVITTMLEKLIRKKNIHWEAFIRKCLELPASSHLAKIEAISIQSSKLFLISEHLNCENLHSVLSRDTKDKGDYYCCSSLSVPDVIKHVAGVLEGMDILKTFGFLHPGLTTKKVLLTKEGQVKLFDFCLAGDAPKIAALKKAQVPTVTLNQFPPEMLLSNHYTETSDVWSTAVVIWEIMSAGSPPFPVDKEVRLDDEAITPSVPWPEKYWQIKDKILFDCWKHNSSLRPSIHHLRGTFVAIFEKLITDSSYEIPIPTTYLPMRALDTAQLTYAEQIYHAGM
ncbi:uncharacterized protein [Apostichopus japonicus]|uniref:uncharacterized protein isoform X2 n=1 Tax=Stichopus japonicus TaxID=307972 RepID=UPI003AB7DA38